MTQRNRQMLMEHTRMYVLPQAKEELPPAKEMPDMQNPGFMDTPVFQLSTFYTVALTYDGEILDIKNEQPALHTDEELEQLAKAVIEEDKIEGTKKSLAYYLADKGEYLVVAFMIIRSSMKVRRHCLGIRYCLAESQCFSFSLWQYISPERSYSR